ncbi:hypothetical protein GCM10022243_48740 [Saccharothrix violaceirubra]|uniref:Uncharacterized protein n=1 Tax=Saccharothrix violaceirubra TaxID=413306 RepID=A0A7W7WU14_9PSEU|nr:hypothetical protein [Saccharothrix violaceirubra]MBB4963785.1 hypothetical protein [Saccharothrix violaceirubra]
MNSKPLPQWEPIGGIGSGVFEAPDPEGSMWRLWAVDDPDPGAPFPRGYRLARCDDLDDSDFISGEHGLYYVLDTAGMRITGQRGPDPRGGQMTDTRPHAPGDIVAELSALLVDPEVVDLAALAAVVGDDPDRARYALGVEYGAEFHPRTAVVDLLRAVIDRAGQCWAAWSDTHRCTANADGVHRCTDADLRSSVHDHWCPCYHLRISEAEVPWELAGLVGRTYAPRRPYRDGFAPDPAHTP